MAIVFQKDGICVAHIKRQLAARPSVELAIFHPSDQPHSVDELEKVAKEVHATRYECTTLVSSGEYQLVSVEAPNVPPDELKTAIRWRLKDLLDFHTDDATIDVLDVPVDKSAEGRTHSMLAVAARNQVVQQRQALFEDAKVPLKAIDIPELAQRNIAALLEPENRGLAMLTFDEDGGLLTVTYSGELYLSRRIEAPLHALTGDETHRNAAFERITLELQRSLDHFDRQYHFITLSKLMLAPALPGILELKTYLASNLYVPVEILDLGSIFDATKVGGLKTSDEQQRYFLALGAALRMEEKSL